MIGAQFVEPTDETVIQFIEWFERENHDVFMLVLQCLALSEHLGQYIARNPIEGMSPMVSALVKYIHQFDASLDFGRSEPLRLAVQKRLYEGGYLEKHMEYKPPAAKRRLR
jgi:hypothetical protein